MTPNDVDNAVATGDKLTALLAVVYRLGGWGMLGVLLTVAVKYVWDERTQSNKALIDELQTGKVQTLQVLSQNSEALRKSAESQEKVADAVEALTMEVRRQK